MSRFKKLVEKVMTEDGVKVKSFQTSSESVIMNNDTTVEDAIATNVLAVNLEAQRAAGAESALDKRIDAESERASASEQSLDDAIKAETTRATDATAAIDKKIDDEITRATAAESTLESTVKGYTDKKIADLINGAPSTLDTLKEIADAMAEDKKVVEALNTAIGTKANSSDLTSHTSNTTAHITAAERTSWNGKQNALTAGSNISISGNTISATDTTYSDATQSAHGLMTANDKKKLDGIASGANAYSLPTATASALGGVKSQTTGTTSGRDYKVQVNSDGTMKVNVPWSDTNTTALGSMTGTLGLAHGGTGATTAAAARTNLGLGSMATQNTTSYDTHDTIKNTYLTQTDAANSYAKISHSHSYLPLSGGTVTGDLFVSNGNNGYVMMRNDNEGGNIGIGSPGGYNWEIDAHDNNLRIYNFSPSGVYGDVGIYTDGSFRCNALYPSGDLNVLNGRMTINGNKGGECFIHFYNSGSPNAYQSIYSNAVSANRGIGLPNAGGTIALTSCDKRLKTNIVDTEIDSALDVINQIQLHSYDWIDKSHSHNRIGFVADELAELDKRLCEEGGFSEYEDENGEMIKIDNIKNVDTLYLLGYVVKSLQELSQENKELKAEIEKLKK